DADRARHRPLLLGVVAGDAPGADLGPLRHEPPEQVDVLVVDPLDALGREDGRLLLDRAAPIGRLGLLLLVSRHLGSAHLVIVRSSHRLRAEVAAGRGGLGAPAPTPAAASAAAPELAAAPAVVLGDLGGGEAEAGPDLVGDDLDDVAPVAVTVLVAALLEPA